MRKVPMIGRTFGELTVIQESPLNVPSDHKKWDCQCTCGKVVAVNGNNLRRGLSRSCGHTLVKHGGHLHPDYNIWIQMKRRCENPSSKSYKDYGGRGIKLCDRWQDFWKFTEDMGPRPTPKHEIERNDNNGNYEPGNCRWATRKEQMQNTRQVNHYEHDGLRLTASQWADKTGIPRQVLAYRFRNKWPMQKALSQSPKFR